MKVIKNYGTVAVYGAKELKLQTIKSITKETRLALVTYKDGMSIKVTDINAEAKELKRLLEEYLDYKTPQKEEKTNVVSVNFVRDVVKSLTSLPAGDPSYATALREATEEDLKRAIKEMEESGGKHATRIKACQNALKKIETKTDVVKTVAKTIKKMPTAKATTHKPTAKAEEKKMLVFPTDDKKPMIIPLKTEGNRTYEECVTKIEKEKEIFIDSNSQYVLNGLAELCKVDGDFRNNFMREDKAYGDFMEFMHKAGMNGYYIRYGNAVWLDGDLALALAIDYYNNDPEAVKAEEEKKREEERRKSAAVKAATKKTTKKKTTTTKKTTTAKKGVKANGKKVTTKKRGTSK